MRRLPPREALAEKDLVWAGEDANANPSPDWGAVDNDGRNRDGTWTF